MTGKRDDRSEEGMDGERGAAEIKCSESPSCVGKLRIGQHVNLNLFRESRKHTARENKALSGKEKDLRSLSSCFLRHPLCVCDQPVAGSSREIPL